MYSDNPLCLVVLSILKETNESISLYSLMQRIEKAGYSLASHDDTGCDDAHNTTDECEPVSDELRLFRKNFIVMNALYQIRKDFRDSGFNLSISSLSIFLTLESQLNGQNLTPDKVDEESKVDRALSDYYLDWGNYRASNQQLVDDLLSNFWKHFTKYSTFCADNDKRSYALKVLGVESDASWENIKEAYRNKVAMYHPDKGGTSAQFIEIREAYQILNLIKRANQ